MMILSTCVTLMGLTYDVRKVYVMVPGIYSLRAWLLYSVWSGLDPIITLFTFRYFHMHLCMLSNPKRNQFT